MTQLSLFPDLEPKPKPKEKSWKKFIPSLNKEQKILLSIFLILFSGFMIFWPEFRYVLIDWFFNLLDMITNLLGWVCVLGGIGLFVYGKWKKSVKKQGFGILSFLIGLWLIGIL